MMDLVMVRWVDTVFEDTCQHIQEAVKTAPVPRVNVGYLLRDGIMAIPKGMIVSGTRLEEKV